MSEPSLEPIAPPSSTPAPVSPPSYPATPAPDNEQTQPIAKYCAPVDDGNLPEVIMVAPPDHTEKQAIETNTPPNQTIPAAGNSKQPAAVASGNQNKMLPARPDEEYTVTPLHLLGDQSDTVDCPFCRRRSETRVHIKPSTKTHAIATVLLLITICGVYAPYHFKWSHDIIHFCQNCDRRVAFRKHGTTEMKGLGTPDHLREVSKYSAAKPAQAS